MLRATIKSLLSRKLRLLLSGLAVVLGVMFVSGAFVLTDTLGRSFDALFTTVYSDTDVEVQAVRPVSGAKEGDPTTVPAAVLDRVRGVPGVAGVTGVAQSDGARVIGSNGKVVTSFGPPRLGTNWTGESDLVKLREGRAPAAPDEIVVNAALAKAAGIHVGDRVGVLTLAPKQMFTLVGIVGYSGGRDSLGGSQVVSFTTPTAQRLMLGEQGVYSAVDVRAARGVSATELRDRLSHELGGGFVVKTGKQLTDEKVDDFKQGLSAFNKVLLGFAGVALFVGAFLIINTFSIIVAQRTRELALMRAIGASRRQVVGAVLLEALVIGLVAAVVGLGAGIGVGALLAGVLGRMGGGDLEVASVGVPAGAVIGAFGVGVLVTLVAALLPALRAARVAPIAALQEAATPDRPLTRIGVGGAVVTATGAGLLGLGLSGKGGDHTLALVLAGVGVSFLGVALLTPLVARPVVGVVGRLFTWSVPGRLGRLNSGRNPRRTAITAAALMVGIALITGVNVVLSSLTRSFHALADTQVSADLIVSGEQTGPVPPTFDASVVTRTAALPGVRAVAGQWVEMGRVDGEQAYLSAYSDLPALATMLPVKPVEGGIGPLGADQLVVDDQTARRKGLHPGGTVRVQLSRGEVHTYTVRAVYARTDVLSGWLLGPDAVRDFRVQQPSWAYIAVRGGQAGPVRQQVDAMLADSPEVSVLDRSGFVRQQTGQIDTVLNMIEILLALAILIAVLGVVNTLALSVLERTRELGLLRAIGMGRRQTMAMVTVEAVVIAVFGALLGLAVGAGLGAAVVRALHDRGVTELAFPWASMGSYLALAVPVGVLAAVLPAVRAARVNVLGAIAHE